MHQSAASPSTPPPGYPWQPRGICRDCQMFVVRGCGGKHHFCSQRSRPWGFVIHVWGQRFTLSKIPGCSSRMFILRTSSVNRSFTFVIIILYICTCNVSCHYAWNSNRTRKNNVLGTEHVYYLRFQLQKSFSVIADPQEISISQVFIFFAPLGICQNSFHPITRRIWWLVWLGIWTNPTM